MRWKIDAILETRLEGPDEASVKKLVQAELWKLIDGLEAALGISMATSVHILGVEPLPDEEA